MYESFLKDQATKIMQQMLETSQTKPIVHKGTPPYYHKLLYS